MNNETLETLNDDELRAIGARVEELLKLHDEERKAKALADAKALKARALAEARAVLATAGLSLKDMGAKKPRPVVTASSTTIAFSGSSAPSEAPSASGVIRPLALAGGASFTTGAGVRNASTSSARAASAPTMSSSSRASTWPCASGGASRLGLLG